MLPTYSLLLDCSVDNKYQPQTTECLKQLKSEIEQKLNGKPPTIGQTWMISGWLPQPKNYTNFSKNAKSTYIRNIAKSCYKNLIDDADWEGDIQGEGEFLGATIFELWRYKLSLKENEIEQNLDKVQDNQHVIIMLFLDKDRHNKLKDSYSEWLPLFCYRNKILLAYAQSRMLKRSISDEFNNIIKNPVTQEQNQSSRVTLQELDKNLSQIEKSLEKYEIDLIKLDYQSSTVETNLSNYLKRWQKLAQVPSSQLDFLQKFADTAKNKYLQLITKDLETLEKSWRLQTANINAIRSRIELDRAKRDRNFQNWVGIFGIGLASASVVASLNKLGEDEKDPVRVFIKEHKLVQDYWLSPTVPLVYSISTFVVIALIILIAEFCYKCLLVFFSSKKK